MSARLAFRVAAAAAGVGLLAGCFGDAPPDPGTASLEVVVGSSQQPDEPCILNRPEVAAGEHELIVIGETGGPVSAVLRGPDGAVVFEADGTMSTQGPPLVTLAEGPHVVQCLSAGTLLGEVRLRVVAAGA